MRFKIAILILLIFLLQLVTPLSAENELLGKSVIVEVPAVTDGEGKIIDVNVTLIPGGSGTLVITGSAKIGMDTYSSIHIAFYTGLILAGENPYKYNGIVNFGQNFERIEGPSASLAVALAFYTLANGDSDVLKGCVVTGAISPDGLSIMVGGILQKGKAACKNGAPLFIVPYSNFILDNNTLHKLFTEEDCSTKPTGVTSVLDAYNVARGFPRSSVEILPHYPPEFADAMKKSYLYFIKKTNSLGASCPHTLSGIINESKASYNKEEYYTAASLAYTAYMQCLYTTITGKFGSTSLLKELAQNILENITIAREKIILIEKKYSNNRLIPLYSLETIGAAEARLWMSEEYAREALESNDYNQTAQLVSAALARYETAILWSSIAKTNWSSSPMISLFLLNKTLDDYYNILNETLEYSKTIAGRVENSALQTYFQELSDLANRISSEGKSNVFLKYGLAGELGYRLLNFLVSINTIDASTVSEYYRSVWVSFATMYSLLMKNGLTPLIPAAYSEYAAFQGLDDYTRLSLIEDSLAHTLPLLYYVYGYQSPHRVVQKAVTIGFGRQELALILDGWELIGIISTVIVFLVFFREVLRARKSFLEQN